MLSPLFDNDNESAKEALQILISAVTLHTYGHDTSFTIDDENSEEKEISSRGIRCVKTGLVMIRREGLEKFQIAASLDNFGSDTVFLSEKSPLLKTQFVRSMIYSEVFFFPREAILRSSKVCPEIWKLGRWRTAIWQIVKASSDRTKMRELSNNRDY